MQSLEKIIDWLNESPKHYIEVYNDDTGSRYGTRFNATQVDEAFFVDLKNKGFNTVSIQRLKNNGSTYPRLNEAQHRFNLGTNQPKEVVGGREQHGQPAPTSQHQYYQPQPAMAMPTAPGLTGVEAFKVYNHDQLVTELKELKAEKKNLEADNKRLERENMRHELNLEGKPGVSDKLLDALQKPQFLQMITAIAQAKAGAGATAPDQGLNAAVNLSRTKLEVIEAISKDEVSDQTVGMAYQVIYHAAHNNQDFLTAYTDLVNKHQQQPQQ